MSKENGIQLVRYAFLALAFLTAITTLAFGWLGGSEAVVPPEDTPSSPEYWFGDIPASRQFKWHACFEGRGHPLQCARLAVPMDSREKMDSLYNGPLVELALVLFPGENRSHPATFDSAPVIINNGGPGGSATMYLVGQGPRLRAVIGHDRDILAFDPRGIGYTTPKADCWAKHHNTNPEMDPWKGELHRYVWKIGSDFMGSIINIMPIHAIAFFDARVRAASKVCEARHAELGSNSVFPHLGNTHTARDILRILDAWTEWRSSEEDASTISGEDLSGQLVYWGFSYGTFIGATFAAMFPHRVGRMVLDSVVDADEAIKPYWFNFIQDTDMVLDLFFQYCYKAERKCDFYRPVDTPQDLKLRYQGILNSLESSPAVFLAHDQIQPKIITIAELQETVRALLYSQRGFPEIASVLDAAYTQDWERLAWSLDFPNFPAICKLFDSPFMLDLRGREENQAIACADKQNLMNESYSDIQLAHKQMKKLSSFGDYWLGRTFKCNGWSIQPSELPIWATSRTDSPIRTSFPILFVGNTYDPVTPFRSAIYMSQKFQNAGLLEIKAGGHFSFAAPSTCAIRAIRAYFRDGEVPPPPIITNLQEATGSWKTCEVDAGPWDHEIDADVEAQSWLPNM